MKAYKFRSLERISDAFDIIINRRLYCADWKFFNDPLEGIFVSTYRTPSNKDWVEKKVKKIREILKRYRVCSLSATFNSHLLWAHYAGGFSGLAIEVELPDDDERIKRVDYRGVFAFVNIDETTDEEEIAKKLLFSKYEEWKYEQEIRILNDSEWYELEKPISRVIVGCRMPEAVFKVLNVVCTNLKIPIYRVAIGDEGLDADDVEPISYN